ncbi:MAG: biotin--[acetyl-CoA-carboxylase] ligase [Bacteroidia bacterium]|nr:biotin--[acetyl-CoA-carboxylase] ligase [Bacteroidia bacterium]
METLFIGKNLIFLPEINSTNSYATNLLKNVKLAEGTVVHTAHQTQGKGQRGSLWIAEHNANVTASVILNPSFLKVENQFFLYIISALACYDTITELLNNSQIDIKIKWPNDILLNQRKVSGILIENNIQNTQIVWSVIGVGINVNQEFFESAFKATSLVLTDGKKRFAEDVMKLFCIYLEKFYLMLKGNKTEELKNLYMERLFGLNKWMYFEINGNSETLLVKGISESGFILLENKEGKTMETDVKQVKWIY